MEILVNFGRSAEQVFVYCGGEMLATYWHVLALTRDESGKYVVMNRDGMALGRITDKAVINESW